MTESRPPKKSETLEVRLPHETKRAFLEACRKEGRTASEAVRGFIDGYIARAAASERLRDRPQPQRSLVMTLASRNGRRGLLAGAVGSLALIGLAVSPSAADIDFRAMFERIDTNADGQVTLAEFAAPRTGGGDVMIMRSERVETNDDGVTSRTGEEFWLPAMPRQDGPASVGLEVRREIEGGELITEEVRGLDADDPMVIGMQTQEFGRFDQNGDGAVDFAEFEARHLAMIQSTFSRLDADADGRLAQAELEAFPTTFGMPEPPQAPPSPFDERAFGALDRDGDGGVTLEEFAAGPATF
jgi:Ca2+-binding EF-hand superfamily protein